MNNKAAIYLTDYMKQQNLSVEATAARLAIPKEKFTAASSEPLMADELLRLCAYLDVRPERLFGLVGI